MGRSNVLFKLE